MMRLREAAIPNPGRSKMRIIVHAVLTIIFRRYWRRHLAAQYEVLIADVGLTRAEQRAIMTLRRAR